MISTTNHGLRTDESQAAKFPGREALAESYLTSLEHHHKAQILRLQANIDNLLMHSVGIDDHARIDNALAELFEKLANEQDLLETVQQYRRSRGL